METYDHYLSLGANCESGFQFRRVLGGDQSNFFNWNVTPLRSLNALLSADFSGICDIDELIYEGNGTLVRDRRYNYQFHWVGDNIESLGNGKEVYEANRSRLLYLASKFRATVASGSSVAFFYTLNGESDVDQFKVTQTILREKFHCRNFSIIIITDGAVDISDSQISPGLFVRRTKRFAPWSDATDGHVSSWDAIFREFPATAGVRLSGY